MMKPDNITSRSYGKFIRTTFGEVSKLEQGLAFNKKNNFLMVDDGIPLLRITDLINNTETKFVDADKVSLKFLSKPTDIIFTRTGQVGLVFKGRIGIVHNNCFRIIPFEGIEPDYMYWFLKQPLVIEHAKNLARGSAQPDLNHDAFKSIPFHYPSLADQHKIANILSKYDDLIENNRRRIQLLEEAARLLYQEWFVRLRFPGHEHSKIVDGVPEGWVIQQIKFICPEIRDGVDPSTLDANTPYIGLEHIPRRSISLISWGYAEEVNSRKYRYQEGDILFGKIRPYFHKVGIAFNSGVTSSDSIVLRPISEIYHRFLLLIVSSDNFVSEVSKTMKEGTKMPRADWKFIEQKEIFIPPDSMLSEFNFHLDPIISQLKTLSMCNIQLKEARDILLPRLMNGVIPV